MTLGGQRWTRSKSWRSERWHAYGAAAPCVKCAAPSLCVEAKDMFSDFESGLQSSGPLGAEKKAYIHSISKAHEGGLQGLRETGAGTTATAPASHVAARF